MPVEILHVELGNALAADQRVLMPRINFAPADTIYASVILAERDATPHHIEATWSHLDSRQTVYAEPRTLALSGEVTTVFHIRKPDGWPGGQYQLQLAVDGHIVQTRLFDVIAPPPVLPQPAPAPPAPAPAPSPTPSP